jgi:Transglutaminase-like superfamily
MKNYLKSIVKFFRFSFQEKTQIIKVFFLLSIFKAGLILLSFEKFKKFYNWFSGVFQTQNLDIQKIERSIFFLKGIAANTPLGFTCLPQALVLKYLLKNDKEVQIIIGVNTETSFKAHAWVEKNHKFLIGDIPFENYTPLWTWA